MTTPDDLPEPLPAFPGSKPDAAAASEQIFEKRRDPLSHQITDRTICRSQDGEMFDFPPSLNRSAF
jgi:hypothetical protein